MWVQAVVPLLKYVRGEVLSEEHWHELFTMLHMPRGTTLEKLTFGDILAAGDAIIGRWIVLLLLFFVFVFCLGFFVSLRKHFGPIEDEKCGGPIRLAVFFSLLHYCHLILNFICNKIKLELIDNYKRTKCSLV